MNTIHVNPNIVINRDLNWVEFGESINLNVKPTQITYHNEDYNTLQLWHSCLPTPELSRIISNSALHAKPDYVQVHKQDSLPLLFTVIGCNLPYFLMSLNIICFYPVWEVWQFDMVPEVALLDWCVYHGPVSHAHKDKYKVNHYSFANLSLQVHQTQQWVQA